MKKNFVKAVVGLCLIGGLLANQGCVALLVGVAAGAGGVVFIKGNLEQNLDNPVKDIYNASLQTLSKMKIEVFKKDLTEHMAMIYARGVDEKRVKIVIQSLTERAANVKIRVGIVGDEARSVEILEEIKKAL